MPPLFPKEIVPERFSRPFIREHLSTRRESPLAECKPEIVALHSQLREVIERLLKVDPASEWLHFHSFLSDELLGGDDAHSGYFEISVIQSDGRCRVTLKQVRFAGIELDEPDFSEDSEEAFADANLVEYLTKEDLSTGKRFRTHRSGDEVVLGFVAEFACGQSLLSDNPETTFGLGDGVLHAISIELPSGVLDIGPPSLEDFDFTLKRSCFPLTEVDAKLLLETGERLLEWAGEIADLKVTF